MSVYAKEEPVYLDTAIQSMLDQTVRTDDFVIVCDGPLTAELDAVLERHLAQNPAVLHLVRLPQNIGTGAALNIGLTHCKIELIAKMDSDDISVLDRGERQLRTRPRLSAGDLFPAIMKEYKNTQGDGSRLII